MAKIIERAHRVNEERQIREFALRAYRGCGLAFPVKEGKVILNNPAAVENFNYAILHPEEYEDLGVITQKQTYWQDAKAICECGHEIFLHDSYYGADKCEFCGRWHNLFGHELLPPEQWNMEDMEE